MAVGKSGGQKTKGQKTKGGKRLRRKRPWGGGGAKILSPLSKVAAACNLHELN